MPRAGQLIRVQGVTGRRSTAQVLRVGPRTLEVRSAEGGPESARDLIESPSVTVEFVGAESIHQLTARAQVYATVHGSSLLLLIDGVADTGRRVHVRTPLEAPATLRNVATGEHVEGRTENMSVGGALVHDLSAPLTLDRTYGFAITPEGFAETITGVAKVVRVESETSAALQITVLSNPSAGELARLLFELRSP